MSSTDRTGKFGPGAISAAEKAVGGGGALPTPPPRPGALHASSLAAQSVTETLATTVPQRQGARFPSLSDEAVRAKVARAGLRQFNRDNPTLDVISTPTGNATTYHVREKNTRGQSVFYVRTANEDFPDTTEPTTYADIAKHITPAAAAAVLGIAPSSSEPSVAARRAATTAKSLGIGPEDQRNGAAKHSRAALLTIARRDLTAKQTYSVATPAFAQARTVKYHREIISGAKPVTPGFRKVVENFSDSSEDESVAALSPTEAIFQYRLVTETKAVREKLARDHRAGNGPRTPARAPRKRAAPAPNQWKDEPNLEPVSKRPRIRSVRRTEAEPANATRDHHPTEARAAHKHSAKGEKELDRKRDSKRGRR